MDNNSVIIRPLLTEKSTDARSENKYVFEIRKDANKLDVAKALEDLFQVNVIKCNVINVKGKPRRLRTRKFGRTRSWKKAVVSLANGQAFPFFEGV